MFLAKDEIIALEDDKKYLILDSAIIDNKSYYKIKEVSDNYDELLGDYKLISVSNEGNDLYINEELSTEETDKLNELFGN